MVRIKAVGDIMLGRLVGKKILLTNPDFPFCLISNELTEADITIGNLETPVCDNSYKSYKKEFSFKASTNVIHGLKNAGFNILNLANNHIMDYGEKALAETITNLNDKEILTVGAGENLVEATKALIININDVCIGFLSFTYAWPAKKNKPGCAPIDKKLISKLVHSVSDKTDVVIVSIHTGLEYVNIPSRENIALFRSIVDMGADLVLGHHPHTIQGIEKYKNGLIAYSLGNFIFDTPDYKIRELSYTKTAVNYYSKKPLKINDKCSLIGMILDCTFDKNGVKSFNIIPTQINDQFQAEKMSAQESKKVIEHINSISEKLNNLDGIEFKEIDEILRLNKIEKMRTINLTFVIRNIYKLRIRHLKLFILWVYANLLSDKST